MIKVFVSSTFKDMHYERDLIHEKVLPQLNGLAAKYADSLDFCDLRWGVDTKDMDSEEGSKKVLSVCLDEIDRCRPYMIVILGERYGWIPEENLISETIRDKKDFALDELEKSVTALEIEYGALSNPKQLEKTLFYYRESNGPMPEIYQKEDSAHWEKLQALKKRIRKITGGKVRTYQIRWDEKAGRPVGQEDFADMVTKDLTDLLQKEWQAYGELSDFEKDQLAQWNMVREKSAQFAAREDMVQRCMEDLDAHKNLIFIQGASGSGKSTVMSRLAVCLKEQGKAVLPIFCGHTSMTGNAMSLIRYLTYFLEEQTGNEHLEDSDDNEAHTDTDRFAERLAQMAACYEQSDLPDLTVLIDGIDQLPADESREKLLFVPGNLSKRLQMVLSCCGDTCLSRAGNGVINLAPLTEAQREELVKGMLRFAGRELPPEVIGRMIGKKDSHTPLYLNLLLTRMLLMNRQDFEAITRQGDGIEAITRYQIRLLEEMPDETKEACVEILRIAAGRFGWEMVRAAAGYLAVSRHGLREQDLESLVRRDGICWNSLDFSLFYKYMRGFFIRRNDGRLDFSHKSIREGILNLQRDPKEIHKKILAHLQDLPKGDPVKTQEFVYHSILADEKGLCVSFIRENPVGSPGRIAAAGDLRAFSMEDGGAWLTDLLREGERWMADASFSYFLNTEYRKAFQDSMKELRIREIVQRENRIYMEQYVLRHPAKENKRALSICREKNANLCMLYEDKMHLKEALELYTKALALSEELAAADNTIQSRRDLAIDRGNLASAYEELGEKEGLQKALELRRSAVSLYEENAKEDPSPEHIRAWAFALRNLGLLFCQLGKEQNIRMGISCLTRAYEIQKSLCGREPARENEDILVRLIQSLGEQYLQKAGKEDIQKAQELYENALKIRRKLAAEKHTWENLRNLALACIGLGRLHLTKSSREDLDQAARLYQEAYEIRSFLAEKLQTPQSRRELSSVCYSLGKVYGSYKETAYDQKALDYYRMDIRISEQLDQQLETVQSKQALGRSCMAAAGFLFHQGGKENLKQALSLGERAAEIFQQLDQKLDTPEIKRELGRCYDFLENCCRELGDETHLEQAVAWGEKDLKLSIQLAKELKTLDALDDLGYSSRNLGNLYQGEHSLRDLKKAKKLYEKACQIFLEVDGKRQTPDSMENVQISQECLAQICFVTEGLTEAAEAADLQETALELCRKRADILDSKESWQDLLWTYLRTGDLYMCLVSPEKDWQKTARDLYETAARIALKNQQDHETRTDWENRIAAISRLALHPKVPADRRKNYLLELKDAAVQANNTAGIRLWQEELQKLEEDQ